MGHDGWMGFGGGIMWLFLLIVIVALVFAITTVLGHSHPRSPTDETPLEELKRRYAAGEIDDDEYERRRKELQR